MEGAGVRICRTVGTFDQRVDPFLMLDELKLPSHQAAAGFPDHPHRGFHTCSIMLQGKMEHKDSMGNSGVITTGGVQWMTAGRGIVHSEMPVVEHGKDLHGFQLWINLPARDKMIRPRYQDIKAEEIPIVEFDTGTSVRVMAGTVGDKTGPIDMRHPGGGMLLDIRIPPNQTYNQAVAEEWNAFSYVYEGSGKLCGQSVGIENAYVFGDGDGVSAEAGEGGLKFLLFAGKPINEPIVQYGPFVMNSALEIQQAFEDYRSGQLQRADDNVWGKWDDEL